MKSSLMPQKNLHNLTDTTDTIAESLLGAFEAEAILISIGARLRCHS